MAIINRPIAPSYMATTSYPLGLQENTGTHQIYLHWTDVEQPNPGISLHSGQAIVTPLPWQEWQMSLATHPDREFANLVVTGIIEGFQVGYDYSHTCKKSPKNMQSVRGVDSY